MFGVAIEPYKSAGLREGFAAEAGIGVHLSAAGLAGMKIDRDAEPLQQPNHRPPRLRVEGVVVTRDKERGAHASGQSLPTGKFGRAMVFDRDTNCLLQSAGIFLRVAPSKFSRLRYKEALGRSDEAKGDGADSRLLLSQTPGQLEPDGATENHPGQVGGPFLR